MSSLGGKKFGFSKQDRLRRSSEFRRVFDEGRRLQSGLLTMYVIENGRAGNRLGLAVGKKAGNSQKRNRIRRVFREAFRLNRHLLPAGLDVVLLPGKGREEFSLAGVEPELVRLFGKLKSARER